jgi:hypothetical protein
MAAKVQWSEWMTALGNIEFDLIVDPGLVSVRFIEPRSTSKLLTVWSEEALEEPRANFANTLANSSLQAHLPAQALARPMPKPVLPTLAQQLQIEDEEDEEELFAALADELRRPTWATPISNQFPSTIPQKSISPASSGSHHSRSSSLSSSISSDCSLFSFDSEDSDSSVTTLSSAGTEGSKHSRRERVRPARVYVDSSKKEVTNYDGGKTTVLTGGVMLGARTVAAKPAFVGTAASSNNWRSTRI